MAVVLYLQTRMIHIHRARKIQRGKGLNLGKERSKRVSLDAGGHPGGGFRGSYKFGVEV